MSPRTKFRATQIIDEDLVTEDELAAYYKSIEIIDGVFPVDIASTDSGTKTVTVSTGNVNNWDLQVGDTAEISGGTADGDYTVASIVSDTEFTVEESIPDSTGEGDLTVYHPVAALDIGVDQRNWSNLAGDDLQSALDAADSQIGGSLPSAAQQGEVLYSKDGQDFEVELPIVSNSGWLVNDDGLLLIY